MLMKQKVCAAEFADPYASFSLLQALGHNMYGNASALFPTPPLKFNKMNWRMSYLSPSQQHVMKDINLLNHINSSRKKQFYCSFNKFMF